MTDGRPRPVHVLGWGATTALGVGCSAGVEALRAGTRPVATACRSPHLAPTPGEPLLVFEAPVEGADLHGRARFVVDSATDEALGMAPPSRGTIGVFAGTTGGFFVDGEHVVLEARRTDPTAWPPFVQRGAGELAAHVAARLGATGPIATYSTACTSSAVALASAARHLRSGTCERAVVVGYDLLSSLTLHGFRSLLLVDSAPCRPFDLERAGLQLGEGCGVVVLGTDAEGPYRVEGSANVLAAGHLTSSATDGSTAEAVMAGALASSGRSPEEVVTLKAHGTGTRDNDLAEGAGIRRLFGTPPPFSSLKGAIGHTLGAAGAVEMALWLAALQAGFVPASAGFSALDPEIGVSPQRSLVPAPRGTHLFNAFGFGGSCIAQVVCDA
ncbi:MAG: beta-ketoacyl synthase N-terminal-like domain-containing protein [Myxococcota bacterium]